MLRIRLSRGGKKKQPHYRVVVANVEAKRDGRVVERIGHYDPLTNPGTFKIKEDRALYWLSVGAQPSDAVNRLLTKQGTLDRLQRLRAGESLDVLVAEFEGRSLDEDAIEVVSAAEETSEIEAVQPEVTEEEIAEIEEVDMALVASEDEEIEAESLLVEEDLEVATEVVEIDEEIAMEADEAVDDTVEIDEVAAELTVSEAAEEEGEPLDDMLFEEDEASTEAETESDLPDEDVAAEEDETEES